MIFRLLLLFLIVWFLFWIIKKQFSEKISQQSDEQPENIEDMIACHYCGIHTPKSSGFLLGEKFYCSREHADLDESNNDGR